MSSTVIHPIIDNLSLQDRNSRQSISYEIAQSRVHSQCDFIIIDKDEQTATIQASLNLDSKTNDQKDSEIGSVQFESIKTTSQESANIFSYSCKNDPKEEIIENPPTISRSEGDLREDLNPASPSEKGASRQICQSRSPRDAIQKIKISIGL